MPEKPVFWHFLWGFAQICVLAMSKTWPSPIFEEFSFPAEKNRNMPDITIFPDFHWSSWSWYFYVFIHMFTWNFVESNSQYFLRIAGTTDCRAGITGFLHFSSRTQFIHEFLLRSFVRFFRIFSINVYICSHLSNFHYQVVPISIQLVKHYFGIAFDIFFVFRLREAELALTGIYNPINPKTPTTIASEFGSMAGMALQLLGNIYR